MVTDKAAFVSKCYNNINIMAITACYSWTNYTLTLVLLASFILKALFSDQHANWDNPSGPGRCIVYKISVYNYEILVYYNLIASYTSSLGPFPAFQYCIL